jgi:predicted CopG family antitoxin
MTKKLTITVSDEVYAGLHRKIGRRKISGFINDIARERLKPRSLAQEYAEAAKNENAEQDARDWLEADVGETLTDEDFSDWPRYPSR